MSQAVHPRTSISAVLLNAFCNRTSQEQAEAVLYGKYLSGGRPRQISARFARPKIREVC